jgi:hypothetical protein
VPTRVSAAGRIAVSLPEMCAVHLGQVQPPASYCQLCTLARLRDLSSTRVAERHGHVE